MIFKEIEVKYRAKDIKISDYRLLAESLLPTKQLQVSSPDHYYVKSKDMFIRYRAGSRPELTVKVKINDKDNFVRTEINIPLDLSLSEEDRLKTVAAFCDAIGFTHNFSIFKTCIIYYYEKFNIVYYLVYDLEMVEKERFIEIEMDEKYPWTSEEEAWNELVKIEKHLSELGITSQNRIKKSLYEMFRK